MAIQYQKYEKGKEKLKLLIKGLPGTGKTTMATQFPNPVLFDYDQNTACLGKLPKEVTDNLRIVRPLVLDDGKPTPKQAVWDRTVKLLKEVCEDNTVGTIVIDNLTFINSILGYKIAGVNPDLKWTHANWWSLQQYLKWLGEELIQAQNQDKHIVVIAHEKQLFDEETGKPTGFSLALQGDMKHNFEMYFTDVWRTRIETRIGQKFGYYVDSRPTSLWTAKCSLNLPNESWVFSEQKESIMKQIA